MFDGVNPGLKSRVTQKLVFEAFDAAPASKLLLLLLEKKPLVVPVNVVAGLRAISQPLVDAPQWASGRDVTVWAKRIARSCVERRVTLQVCAEVADAMVVDKGDSLVVEKGDPAIVAPPVLPMFRPQLGASSPVVTTTTEAAPFSPTDQ